LYGSAIIIVLSPSIAHRREEIVARNDPACKRVASFSQHRNSTRDEMDNTNCHGKKDVNECCYSSEATDITGCNCLLNYNKVGIYISSVII
jgi:hypothetical protein